MDEANRHQPKTRAAPPEPWRSALLGSLLAGGVAGSLVAFVSWTVHLDVALAGRWTALHGLLAAALPASWLGVLRATSLDASTLTPLIVWMFCAELSAGGWRALRRAQLPEGRRRRTFPFHPTHAVTWVQLGLIGTLWGFLLLGNRLELGLDPDESVELLVTAFGTALVSTFAGVVAAFVAAPLVIGLFRVAEPDLRPADSPVAAVEDLDRRLRRLGEAAAGLEARARDAGDALEVLHRQVDAPALEVKARRVVDEAVRRVREHQDRRLDRMVLALDTDLAALGEALGHGLGRLGEGLEAGQGALVGDLTRGLDRWSEARDEADAEHHRRHAEALAELRAEAAEAERRLVELVRDEAEHRRRDVAALGERMAQELRDELERRAGLWARGGVRSARRFRPARRSGPWRDVVRWWRSVTSGEDAGGR